ncbi:unnamed protein product, partial [Onchocerca ochengi]|uniref:RNase_PH domain-containing protein n=1 Tax=Onchocerca ochengi TaxID=42157 RepID=A0A182EVX1_ONCOC
ISAKKSMFIFEFFLRIEWARSLAIRDLYLSNSCIGDEGEQAVSMTANNARIRFVYNVLPAASSASFCQEVNWKTVMIFDRRLPLIFRFSRRPGAVWVSLIQDKVSSIKAVADFDDASFSAVDEFWSLDWMVQLCIGRESVADGSSLIADELMVSTLVDIESPLILAALMVGIFQRSLPPLLVICSCTDLAVQKGSLLYGHPIVAEVIH